MTTRRSTWLAPIWFVLAVSLFLSATGCGGKQFGEVTGKVTINGEPVTAGTVYFVSVEDPEHTGGGPIGPDGSFKASAPVGKVKMAVQTSAFKPRPKNAPAPAPKVGTPGAPKIGVPPVAKKMEQPPPSPEIFAKSAAGSPDGVKIGTKYVDIPDKYEDVQKSGLEFEIKKGPNDLGEIKLTGK